MLAGGLFTDLFAIESHMRLSEGETRNYSEDSRRVELAVIDPSHSRMGSGDRDTGSSTAPANG